VEWKMAILMYVAIWSTARHNVELLSPRIYLDTVSKAFPPVRQINTHSTAEHWYMRQEQGVSDVAATLYVVCTERSLLSTPVNSEHTG
jgi:hypothetical protein